MLFGQKLTTGLQTIDPGEFEEPVLGSVRIRQMFSASISSSSKCRMRRGPLAT